MISKKFETNNLWVILSFVFSLLFLLFMYWPALSAPIYTTDDQLLILQPQIIKAFQWASIKSVFTFGTGADYYPIRDLSYMLDRFFFGDEYFYYRVHNIILLWGASIFLYLTMRELRVVEKRAVLLALIWAMHFYHSEMLMWISARKDLLAIFFILIASYLFVSGFRQNKTMRMCGCILFFWMSLLSKASFALLPFALIFFLGFNRELLKNRLRLTSVSVLLSTSVFYSLLQRYFYSNITNMKISMLWSQRIKLSVTALGKMSLGVIGSSVNAVDFLNLGDWGIHNQAFFYWGLLVWGMVIAVSGDALVKKRKKLILFLVVLSLLYMPVCGLLFPHRIFYSVRYFEPILVFLVIGTALFLRKKESPIVLIALVSWMIFNVWFTAQEAGYWILPSMQKEKALMTTPHSLDQKALLLSDWLSEAKNQSASEEYRVKIDQLAKELEEKCPIAESESASTSCILFYKLGYEVNKSNKKTEIETRYYKKFQQALLKFNSKKELIIKYELEHSMFLGSNASIAAQNYLDINRVLTTEDDRILFLAAGCLIGRDMQDLKNEFALKNLLFVENIKKYSELNFADNVKLKLSECRLF